MSRPHPSNRRRGRDEHHEQPGKQPHEDKQKRSMLKLKKLNHNKHHPCKISSEDQSPYCLYIVVAMRDNLSDQIAHVKVCSSYNYEQHN